MKNWSPHVVKITELGEVFIPQNATIESLKDEGEYDYLGYDDKQYLTDQHFKVTVTGPRHLCLVHFEGLMVTSQYVEEFAEDIGCKVALMEDLLSVGAHPKYRDLQRQFSITALGSSIVMDGHHSVPRLTVYHGERGLCLESYDFMRLSGHRFLLVKKDDAPIVIA